eukprot:251757-Prymnesium_polylepis.1
MDAESDTNADALEAAYRLTAAIVPCSISPFCHESCRPLWLRRPHRSWSARSLSVYARGSEELAQNSRKKSTDRALDVWRYSFGPVGRWWRSTASASRA